MSAGKGILIDPDLRLLRWMVRTGIVLLVLVGAVLPGAGRCAPGRGGGAAHRLGGHLVAPSGRRCSRCRVVFLVGGLQVALLDGALMADVIVLLALFRLGEHGRRRLRPVWLLLLTVGCIAAAVSWTWDERGEETYQ